MKATAKLLTLVLLSMPTATWAQESIEAMFETIGMTKGIDVSTSRSLLRDDAGNVEEETVKLDLLVGKPNFKLFEELQEAFEEDGKQATTFYSCFNPMEGSDRQLWAIKTKQDSDFRIGEKENSSYAVVTFADKDDSRHRTVYATEWWSTGDKDMKQGVLIRSYGDKPTMASTLRMLTKNDFDKWREDLRKLNVDSIRNSFKINIDSIRNALSDKRTWEQFDGLADAFSRAFSNSSSADKPLDLEDDVDEWMAKAKQRMSHLSNADWHRFFGLITQRLENYVDGNPNPDKETCIVYAGLIIDLVNSSSQLDKEEKRICSARLREVANKLNNRSSIYIRDLLMLASKKLEK